MEEMRRLRGVEGEGRGEGLGGGDGSVRLILRHFKSVDLCKRRSDVFSLFFIPIIRLRYAPKRMSLHIMSLCWNIPPSC